MLRNRRSSHRGLWQSSAHHGCHLATSGRPSFRRQPRSRSRGNGTGPLAGPDALGSAWRHAPRSDGYHVLANLCNRAEHRYHEATTSAPHVGSTTAPQPYIPDLDADQSRSHNSLSGISHHKAGNTDILEEAPMDTVKEYDARVDGKHRVTLRGARYDYYNVKELANGCYILEPRELTVPEGISSATLADMDTAVANARGGGLCPHRPLRFLGRARAVRHTHGHSGDGASLEQSANQAPHEQGQQAGGPALREAGQAPSRG